MNLPRWVLPAIVIATATWAGRPLHAEVIESTKDVGRTTVHYKVVLPDGYEPGMAYSGVLVFGGGPQTMRTIDGALTRNFRPEAERRGYIVVAPAAPNGELFFQGGERVLPQFLDMVLSDYEIRHGKFHVAGPSNGGIAAFHVAAAYPDYFISVTAFPGYMWQPSTAKLQAISKLCVFMYVGELDEYRWHNEMKREAEVLSSMGTLARYMLEAGQPHRLETLAGSNARRLFDGFEEAERVCGPG
jgi:poly(3-hydroxybutyrate) depolymerase